jgi:hypothetical protein
MSRGTGPSDEFRNANSGLVRFTLFSVREKVAHHGWLEEGCACLQHVLSPWMDQRRAEPPFGWIAPSTDRFQKQALQNQKELGSRPRSRSTAGGAQVPLHWKTRAVVQRRPLMRRAGLRRCVGLACASENHPQQQRQTLGGTGGRLVPQME